MRLARVASAVLAGLVITFGTMVAHAANESRLRIAITPVLVEHYLEVNRQLIAYVGEKLGQPTDLVQRRSYKEISDLLEKGEVDVAFVCGRPYVIDHERFGLELLAAPLVYDQPIYYSYVIVPRDSPIHRFEELRGKRYAFSDPLSNSAHLVPVYMLARMGETPEHFFTRSIFTYSHSANVEAVAVKFVDGASVDSYVYDYLAATNPRLTEKTRIIERSPPHGITPVVVRADLALASVGELAGALAHEIRNPLGSVVAAAKMLSAESPQAAEYDRPALLRVITDEARRLDRILSDFLDFARPRAPLRQPHSLNGRSVASRLR